MRTPTVHRSPPNPNQGLERRKLELECQTLEKDNQKLWRFFQWLAMFAPAAAFLIAVLTLADTQHQRQDEELRSLLRDIGAKEEHLRLAAVSRLSAYQPPSSLLAWLYPDRPFEVRQQQIIKSVTAALRLENNLGVKREMLSFLQRHGDNAIEPLKRLRIDLIRELKLEQRGEDGRYWDNLRDTLFHIGIILSTITKSPPDFRCFPFKGLKLRQYELPEKADFTGATLAAAELWGGALRGAIFDRTNLYKAIIKHVDLTGASFHHATLSGTTFGPDVEGLEVNSFYGSDWWLATWTLPSVPDFPERMQKQLDKRRDNLLSSPDSREKFCRELLTKNFEVKP